MEAGETVVIFLEILAKIELTMLIDEFIKAQNVLLPGLMYFRHAAGNRAKNGMYAW